MSRRIFILRAYFARRPLVLERQNTETGATWSHRALSPCPWRNLPAAAAAAAKDSSGTFFVSPSVRFLPPFAQPCHNSRKNADTSTIDILLRTQAPLHALIDPPPQVQQAAFLPLFAARQESRNTQKNRTLNSHESTDNSLWITVRYPQRSRLVLVRTRSRKTFDRSSNA